MATSRFPEQKVLVIFFPRCCPMLNAFSLYCSFKRAHIKNGCHICMEDFIAPYNLHKYQWYFYISQLVICTIYLEVLLAM